MSGFLRVLATAALALALVGWLEVLTADAADVVLTGGDLTSLESAIGVSSAGEVIQLAGETWTGCAAIASGEGIPVATGHDITIEGVGQDATIIDCENSGRAFYLNNPSFTITIRNMTIRNGFPPGMFAAGGAITTDAAGANLRLEDVTLEDNAAPVAAALFLRAGALEVLRATVSGNYADFFGSGGIYIEDSDVTVADSTFVDNTGTGLGIGGGALTMIVISGGPNTAVITGSTFLRNAEVQGGALLSSRLIGTPGGYAITVSGSTFADNSAASNGGCALILSTEEDFDVDVVFEDTVFRNCSAGGAQAAVGVIYRGASFSSVNFTDMSTGFGLVSTVAAFATVQSTELTMDRVVVERVVAGNLMELYDPVTTLTDVSVVDSDFGVLVAFISYALEENMSLLIDGLTVDNTVFEDGFVRLQLNDDTVDTIQAEDVVVRNVTVTDGSLFTIVDGVLNLTDSSFYDVVSTGGPDSPGAVIAVTNGEVAASNVTMVRCVAGAAPGVFLRGSGAVGTLTRLQAVNCSSDDTGVVAALAGATLTADDCTFVGNQAFTGSGIYLSEGTFDLSDLHFEGNTATGAGGGLVAVGSDITIGGSSFVSNSAASGGGAVLDDCRSLSTGVLSFEGNRAVRAGGGLLCACVDDFTGVTVRDNAVPSGIGGGMAFFIPSDLAFTLPVVSVTDSTFDNNTALVGAGVYIKSTSFAMSRVNATGNAANRHGGFLALDSQVAFFVDPSTGACSLDVNVTDSRFAGNSAGKSGGVLFVPACSVSVDGVEFDSNQAGVSGGAVALTDSHASFANVDSRGNAAVDQGGFLNAVDSDLVLSAVTDAAADASRGGSIYIERSNVSADPTVLVSGATADYGAGVFQAQSQAAWGGARFEANVARVAGGASYVCGLACGGSIPTANVTDDGGAIDSGSPNVALVYGNTSASDAATIEFVNPPPVSKASGVPLATISVRFLDAFGSVVDDGDIALAFSPDAAATVLGAVRSAVVGGTAVFTDLSLAVDTEDDLDATYTFTVALALNPTVSVSVAVTVEDCGSGEGILDASLSPVVCVECPEGTSAPAASSRCEPCMPGTYANTKGLPACIACQPGTATSEWGLPTACPGCIDQTYANLNRTYCVDCPFEVANCDKGEISAKPGFFMFNDTDDYTFGKCPPGYCSEGSNNCTNNRGGFLCGECIGNTIKWQDRCIECNRVFGWVVVAAVLVNIVFAVYIIFFQETTTGRIKILTFFAQTLGLVYQASDTILPAGASVVWTLFNLNLDVIPNTCIGPIGFFQLYVSSLLMPLVLFLTISVIYVIEKHIWGRLPSCRRKAKALTNAGACCICCSSCLGRFRDKSRKRERYRKAFFYTVLFMYTPTMRAILSVLNCRPYRSGSFVKDDDAETFLVADLEIQCTDASGAWVYEDGNPYFAYRIVSLILLLVYVFPLPLLIWGVMFYLNRTRDMSEKDVLKRYGVLYQPYKKKFYQYESFIQIRKTLVACVVIFMSTNENLRSLVLLALFVAMFLIHILARPFHLGSDNLFESASLLALMAIQLPNSSSWIAAKKALGETDDYTPLYGLFFSVPAAVVVGYIIRLIVAECQPADKKGVARVDDSEDDDWWGEVSFSETSSQVSDVGDLDDFEDSDDFGPLPLPEDLNGSHVGNTIQLGVLRRGSVDLNSSMDLSNLPPPPT